MIVNILIVVRDEIKFVSDEHEVVMLHFLLKTHLAVSILCQVLYGWYSLRS